MNSYIYLDYCATTPVDANVLAAMLPWFTQKFGNPSSRDHPMGAQALKAVHNARGQVADALNVAPHELTFTASATEAINIALRGIFGKASVAKPHFISCTTEHKAVLETLSSLEKLGAKVTLLPVDSDGNINLDVLADEISSETVCVALMWVNNETGVIHPVEKIAAICRERKVPFLCDGTQALGKIPVDLARIPIDMLAFSGHKIYAPKGVGGLFISDRAQLRDLPSMLTGGGQENGLRSGTLNVPGIVGLREAAAQLSVSLDKMAQIKELRDCLESGLAQFGAMHINGGEARRVAHVSNIRFPGIRNEDLIQAINLEVAVSTGSSCNSVKVSPSHVLKAMGLSDSEAFSAVRFSLGKDTTRAEIERVIQLVGEAIKKLSPA